MGKAAKWFRGLLGFKKHDSVSASTQPPPSSRPASTNPQKEKRRWSFVKSYREKDHQIATKLGGAAQSVVGADDVDPNKHAIAVAAATAAVAEAAVAAAHAAAAVVRLTSSRRCGNVAYGGGRSCGVHDDDEWWAAVKIQSAFRGYLARKALRALKGLVRLQALVRGHIERKRTVEWLRQMQALLRAQARARAGRSQVSESSQSSSKSSQPYYLDPATPEKSEHVILRAKTTKYDQLSKLKELQRSLARVDDERSDKILEIDTGKHHFTTEHRNLLYPSQHAPSSDHKSHSLATSKDSAQPTVKFTYEEVDSPFCTADNSPQFFSASSRGGSCRRSPFTPSKSDGFLSGYSDHPNYMAYTESSRAKARSLSAPKQRPHFDRSGSSKRNSIHGFGDSRSASHKVSALHANFTNKAYPGSGRLDRIGMPLRFKC